MNGIFDLGGTDGIGPVVHDHMSEPVFRAEWEKAAFAMFAHGARAGLFNIDEFRHTIEQMDPADYLLSNYYEHWMHVIEHCGTAKDLIDPDELEKRAQYYLDNPDAELPVNSDPAPLVEFVNNAMTGGFPASRDVHRPPTFSVGDEVVVKTDSPTGHTRRARYIRGRRGVITAARGAYVYPDTAGNSLGESPEHVYTVKFTASELWGEDTAEPNTVNFFDVWEPYLDPAPVVATSSKDA
jgi:nitrile hydratase beta subunit